MNELPSIQFHLARPLFDEMKHFVIPQAVLAGHNPGRIFVDDPVHPTAAFLWTRCGYYFLVGASQNQSFQQDLHELIFTELIPLLRERGENGFILITSDSSQITNQNVILKNRCPVQIYRRIFTFEAIRFAAIQAAKHSLPAEYALQRIDAARIAQFDELSGEITSTWGDVQTFLTHGRGFCLLKGNELVSMCLSIFASETADEISICTVKKYCRQGWGQVVAAAFIEDCLMTGRHPNWECWWENEPSVQLAEKLGYTMQQDYPVFYWEENA